MTEAPPQTAAPKVTIAIPTLNRVGYLRLALESALAQTYGNLEVVVSNNASSDETATYLASCTDPRLHILHQAKQLSMIENWNACVAVATGEYLLVLSDDDLLEPDAIQELIAGYFDGNENDPAPGIVYCGGRIIDSAGEVIRAFKHSPGRETARELIPAFFRGERDLWFCAILFRTADVLPGFSTDFQLSSDSAMWIAATIQHGSAAFIAKELARYRVHQSITFTAPLDQWLDDLTHLGEFAIEQMTKANDPDPVFAENLRWIIRRLITQITPQRINHSFRSHRFKALVVYGRHLSCFLSPFGMKTMARGLVSLFLSDNTRVWLRKLREKQPARLA